MCAWSVCACGCVARNSRKTDEKQAKSGPHHVRSGDYIVARLFALRLPRGVQRPFSFVKRRAGDGSLCSYTARGSGEIHTRGSRGANCDRSNKGEAEARWRLFAALGITERKVGRMEVQKSWSRSSGTLEGDQQAERGGRGTAVS